MKSCPIHAALRLFALLGISIAVLLGNSPNGPAEAQTAQTAPSKACPRNCLHHQSPSLAKLNAVDPDLKWIGTSDRPTMVITPYGPCATLVQLAPTQIAVQTGGEYDPPILLPNWERATQTARQYCTSWYAEAKAKRLAAAEIDAQWQKDHAHPDLLMDDRVSAPILIYKVEPEFPEQSGPDKILKTVVTVNATIDENGNITNLTLPKPVGKGFDEAAIVAAKQYRFKPGTKAGKPVPTEANIEINFQRF